MNRLNNLNPRKNIRHIPINWLVSRRRAVQVVQLSGTRQSSRPGQMRQTLVLLEDHPPRPEPLNGTA